MDPMSRLVLLKQLGVPKVFLLFVLRGIMFLQNMELQIPIYDLSKWCSLKINKYNKYITNIVILAYKINSHKHLGINH
jgi:hypothetical protein